MFDVIFNDPLLTDLIIKHRQIFNIIIKKQLENYESDSECVDLVNSCVSIMNSLGFQYGHHVRHRKCANKFIKGTKHCVSLINIGVSYKNLICSLVALYKQLCNKKNVLFVSKKSFNFLKDNKLDYVCHVKQWIGGTLTNSHYVFRSYNCKLYSSRVGYISFIFLLNPENSYVLSKEVKIYNESTNKDSVNLCFISDTNMKFMPSINTTEILLNDESPYFRFFINAVMCQVFENLKVIT